MILILDNNKYRRHDIYLSLFMKKYIVAEHSLDNMEYYTKPFMTVYINPTSEQIEKIKNEDTLTIIAKNNFPAKPKEWMNVIPLDKNLSNEIIKLYEQNCIYGRGREIVGVTGMEGKYFTVGGSYMNLTPKQLNVIKLFMYNPNKKFELYDASSYFDFNADREEGFMRLVHVLNSKSIKLGKEILIKCENNKYFISPELITY